MSFSVQFPFLWIIASLILSAGLSFLLYQNNPLKLEKKGLQYILNGLRFLSLFIICFLLLGPLFKYLKQETLKPIIAIALDNSESVLNQKNNEQLNEIVLPELAKLKNELGENFEIKTYAFGEFTRLNDTLNSKDKLSNLSDALETIENEHYNLNLAAIVLASDGIYNRGENPIYKGAQNKTPVYTIGLGDTTRRKDTWIKQVRFNELVYEGNNFTIQVAIAANYYKGSNLNYTINEGNTTLLKGNTTIANDPFQEQLNLTLPAAKEGLHTYTISLSPLAGESNLKNNTYTIQVQAIKTKQKIVLVAQSPHPDVSAIVQSLKTNPNYEVQSFLVQEYKEEFLNEASLFILHQLPANNGLGENLIKTLQQKNKPIFFILGKQSNTNALSRLGIVNIVGPQQNFNEAQAILKEDFSLFLIDQQLGELSKKLAPLFTPYGTYKTPADAQVLLTQQIGYVKTELPLLFFSQSKGTQNAVLCGEGFWRWRLQEFLLNQNQQITEGLLAKIVQFTAGKNDQSKFRVNPIKLSFDENESVLLEAELYNESYELIQDKEIGINFINEQGKKYTYTFSKNSKAYELDAGKLPPGNYAYEAKVANQTNYPIKKGKFSVKSVQAELYQLRADHLLLQNLAQETGAKFYLPNNIKDLQNELSNNAKMKPVVYEEEILSTFIQQKWIFGLIFLLLAGEWFIRKWNGFI
jgi:hypothetical protein